MLIELVAPAGNLEKLKIAILYGADAVYLAGQKFGLRSGTDNFTLDEIEESVRFIRDHQKKIYLVINAYISDEELSELPEFIKQINKNPPDALICSDMGVIEIIRENTSIPIHLSTQTSVINSSHASLWKMKGIKRIVIGRELSIAEASIIGENNALEIEMFVHGALCMSYSGHCVISNYIAGRDSNRGGCIQNCRYQYNFINDNNSTLSTYFMSSKDLIGLNALKGFINNKITSLKIEGRMKSNLYLATTVKAYREALRRLEEEDEPVFEDLVKELRSIPHRDYTEGSLFKPADKKSVYDHLEEIEPDYEMAGKIVDVDYKNNRFLLLSKNKLLIGDNLEIIPFQGESICFVNHFMENIKGEDLQIIQPHNLAWIPILPGVKKNMVVKKFKNKKN